MLSESPQQLNEWHKDLTIFLKNRLQFDLHQNKRELNKISRVIDFAGYFIKPRYTLAPEDNKMCFQGHTGIRKICGMFYYV